MLQRVNGLAQPRRIIRAGDRHARRDGPNALKIFARRRDPIKLLLLLVPGNLRVVDFRVARRRLLLGDLL